MESLDCGKVSIPACFIRSISWTKQAKVIKHYGGYVSSRGFEATEISVKASFDVQSCAVFGYKPDDIYQMVDAIKTDRIDEPDVFRWCGYAIYPELEFALTNINKTYISDNTSCVSPSVECDLVFSGVRAVKNVNRERALSLESIKDLPEVVLSANDKDLIVQDALQINKLITTFDSVDLDIDIGSDLDFVSRDSFLDRLISDGVVYVDLPQGKTKYYIISASLVDESLSIVGSFYNKKAAQTLIKTYQDTTIDSIIKDICDAAGIESKILITGHVDYYRAFGAPLDLLKELQQSAGFIMSVRKGVLTIADLPEKILGSTEIVYNEMQSDGATEPINGVYWYDGIHSDVYGNIDKSSKKLLSAFRSNERYASRCLRFLKYNQNSIVIDADLLESIDAHSEILINSNGSIVNALVEFAEFDWVNNTMRLECHYLGDI
jgi:hypothetical protein